MLKEFYDMNEEIKNSKGNKSLDYIQNNVILLFKNIRKNMKNTESKNPIL